MSRGIYGFAICGLKIKVYLWLLYCTKGEKYINVSTCSDSFYFERSRIHLSVIARKRGGGTSDRENLYSGRGLIHKYTVCSREKSAKSLGENAKPCRWYRAMICQHSLHIREYWMINRGPGFLAVVGFGFSTITHPPSPVSKLDRRHTGSLVLYNSFNTFAAYIPACIYLVNRSLIGNSQQIKRFSPQLQRFYYKTMYYIRSIIDISR
jgi:hypothetical protein